MVGYNLASLREKIDSIDEQIVSLLEERFKLSRLVGTYKKERGLPVEDNGREEEMLKEKKKLTSLNEIFIEKLFEFILEESKRIQAKA